MMTALLDTPLPQLRPPAPAVPMPERDPAVAVKPASTAVKGTRPALPPLQAPRHRSGALPPHPPNPRARSEAPRTPACREGCCVTPRPVTCISAPDRLPLRLTRRARLLVTMVSAVSMLAVIGLAGLNAHPTQGRLRDAPGRVEVQAGDTLWQIAAEVAPAEDPAAVVELLRSANDLDGAALQPGRVLVVPQVRPVDGPPY